MSKLKLPVFALSLAAFGLTLAACSARSTATPASTQQPPATVTAPAPTVTAPAPSATVPAPTPTTAAPTPTSEAPTEAPPTAVPTDAAPATPDPNEGLGELIYADPLDGSSGWNWGFSDDAATFGIENGELKASMNTSAAWWRFTLGPDDLNAANQQVRVTARPVTCEGSDEYGLIFRGSELAEGGYDLYVFKLRCDGAARFEAVLDGQTTVLADWTSTPAIETGVGAQNTLVAWMNGGEFRFYVNEQYVFSAEDDGLSAGYYGFYLMDRTDGGLTVTFDDLLAREVSGVAAGQ